jgi:alanyl-tRNA synthetase
MNKTVRLFDAAPKASEFEATVLSCRENDDGKYLIILDKTLFFPEEGGQTCDTGYISDIEVSYVYEKNGVIYHTADKPLPEGISVTGRIYFPERFRKIQNHTAEHIVSGLIHRNFGYNNVGFHLSRDEMTADFDGELDDEALKLIENLANTAVFECHTVRGYYPTPDELERIEYRSKLDLKENVRIVEIEGVDRCACCAPHVQNTGEVGLVKILRAEKYKGGVRLYMKAGYDALEGYGYEYEQCRRISVAISAKHSSVAEGVERLLEEMDALKSRLSKMKREMMAMKLDSIEYTNGNLCIFDEDGDMLYLRNLVNEAKKRCGGICACFCGNDSDGYKYIISSTSVDLRALSREINSAIDGRGGGSVEMIQGSCKATREKIEKYFDFNE